jgi:spermidine/putrescine transport system substrate-binding protein
MPSELDPLLRATLPRRRLLKYMGAGALLGSSGLLAACRRNVTQNPAAVTPSSRPPIGEEPGVLKVYEWAGYEAKWLWRDYAQKGYPDPKFAFFTNTQEAIAKTAGGYEWDVSHPESTEFPAYVDLGLIQPWDTSLLSNWSSLNPELQKAGQWDGEQYEIVLDWGYSGVIIRTDHVDPAINSYNYLFDDRYAGHISWWDTVAMLSIAGLVLGVESDVIDMAPADLEASKNFLIQKKTNLHDIWTDFNQMWDNIRQGSVWTAYSWPDTFVVLKDEVPVHYSKPKEGVLGWAEGLILHSESQNFFHAHEYADAWAAADVGQRLVSSWGYGHSNLDVDLTKIDPDVVEAFGLETPIASLEATEFGYYVPDYSDYSRAWDEVKAA